MSLKNMSEEECTPPKCPRQDNSLYTMEASSFADICMDIIERHLEIQAEGRSYAEQIIDQLPCNGKYFFSNPFKVTILANGWGWRKGSWEFNSILKKELSKQLARFPHVKVTVLVPEGSCNEIDKRDTKSHNFTIVEAKKKPGVQNPNDWLCFPPKGLTTDIVIGVGERLCKMAQIFKELHHCKSIFVGCDSFEESFSRDAELRDDQAKMEDEFLGESNVQPMMQMADLPVAVGPKRAEKLSVSLSWQGKEVFKLTPGILGEFADVTQTLCDRKKFRILVAGHGHPRYFHKEGLDTVAKAVAGLEDRSYEIILVGAAKGEHGGFIEKFHECGVPKHQLIIRSPPKDEEEMKRWLLEADLAIVPSGEQEFGMFGLIALSSGLPILVHSASGLGEALEDVAGGWSSIVESEDVTVWSEAIKKVRNKVREVRLEEADSLRKHYNEKYSWEKQCEALVKEMQKMASGMNFCSTRHDPVTWNQGECIAQLQEQKDQEVERLTERLQQTVQAVKRLHRERESFRLDNEGLMLLPQRMTEEVKTLKQEIEEEKYKRIKAEERSEHLSGLQEQKDQEVERLTERLQQTVQAVKQLHRERESFRLDNEGLMLSAQRKTEEVKTLTLVLEDEKCKRIKAEECSQHLSELQEQKDQEVERLTEKLQQTEQAVKQSHHEREEERESFRLDNERLAQRKTEEVKTLTLVLEEEKCKRIKAEECSQHWSEALRELIKSKNILQQHVEKLIEESQGTSEQMRQTFQEVDQARLELDAEHESLRLEKERWSDERMTDVEKRLGQKLDEQIRKRTKAEEISRYLLEENCQLNARVKELMSRQAELAEVSCSAPSPDTVQENLVESNNDLTVGEANEESDEVEVVSRSRHSTVSLGRV